MPCFPIEYPGKHELWKVSGYNARSAWLRIVFGGKRYIEVQPYVASLLI